MSTLPPSHANDSTETVPFLGPRQAAPGATGVEASAGPPSLVGSEFGRYVLEEELGRGGMGVVFKARQKDLDRPVALKMILSSHLASPDLMARFHDEARIVASLQHPNIVAIYEAGQQHGQPFFAMQYVAGPSMAQALKQRQLTRDQGTAIVLAVARAVDHLHQHQIIHRDLKPSNILLDQNGVPFVTDFGLVKLLSGDSHKTSTGVIVGTPSYMAPEQAAGRAAKVGPCCDVYSLGAILYEVLTGRPPFKEDTPLDTLVQVLEGEPLRPRQIDPNVAPAVEMICLRCLEKSPDDRYPSASSLAADLESYLKDEDISLKKPSLAHRARHWARRQPALASKLVTLVVVMALAQVTYHLTHPVSLGMHLVIQGTLACWALASIACQRLIDRPDMAESGRFLWSGLDMVFFTMALFLDEAFGGPLLVGYPVLIAGAGLWFRTPLVWFTTALAGMSYVSLLVLQSLETGQFKEPHKHLMFLVSLGAMGFIVAFQVQRVRALNQFYENRPLP